jgi:hypothetical protein
MREKQYKVLLTQAERDWVSAIPKKGNHPARQITRAHILLLLDQKPEGKKGTVLTDAAIAERCHCDTKLVYRASKQYAEQGLNRVLMRKKRETPPVPPKVTGEVEAKILAMACSQPPRRTGQQHLLSKQDRVEEIRINRCLKYLPFGT